MTSSEIAPAHDLPALLTEPQLAERWGVNPGSLANARCSGRMPVPCIRPLGRVRYRREDVLAYEADTGQGQFASEAA